MDIEHLFVDLLHRHTSSEHGSNGQVTSVSWITGSHHVLGIEHLLSQFWNGQGAVLLGSTGGEWGETRHEKVKTREWNLNNQSESILIFDQSESISIFHRRKIPLANFVSIGLKLVTTGVFELRNNVDNLPC